MVSQAAIFSYNNLVVNMIEVHQPFGGSHGNTLWSASFPTAHHKYIIISTI